MALNLATILRESARSRPDKVALISGATRVTYAELDAASDRFAAGLTRRSVEFRESMPKNAANKIVKREL